ncbi:DUF58 domain-containing protein [Wenzhouxiangella marina]|uniref:Membrane protein n=1 Tax=Wenzhouxiangella marina TaxID=1579979 RepID=A0A0K0XWT1_9GAMM|nr:DUF58 domain-containing protein [Wenzhouxiangella marina]AKS42138.1 membrane protein [Wenzhouxiangella marina]MBB6086090.1 uncharacterized protein (DUF58 family) [Wenzhouxiangella marina]
MSAVATLRNAVQIRLDRWVKRRARATPPLRLAYRQIFILPTRFGWLLGLLMFGMLLGSLNFNNNLGLLTTFIVAGLALNSMLLAYRNLRGLKIQRCMARPVFAGQPARLRIDLINDEARPRPGLQFECSEAFCEVDLPANASGEAELELPTRARGWMNPGRIGIRTTYPTGLFTGWAWFWPERSILIWPRPAESPPPLPLGQGQESGREVRREPEGESFHSLRNWRQGDPLHRIAWKASQRHQTLLSREFRAEQSDHLMLDLDRAPGRDLEERISVLTAWVLQADQEQLPWTLSAGGQILGPDFGDAHAHRCLDVLAEL